jgi:aerobic C4-dicarboxylate transport protein
MRLLRSLYVQVLIAIVIGVYLGHFYPEFAVTLNPLADFFLKLIKMIIGPVIFCTVVLGIAGMENLKSVGRTGALALIYFEVLSTVALVIGLVVVNVVAPGEGMNRDPATLNYAAPGNLQTVTQFLLGIIPDTLASALTRQDILPVLFVAILAGFALQIVGERGKLVYAFVEQFSRVLFVVVGFIMRVAPIGALGAMAFTIGKYGIGSLKELGALMLCFYGTCLLFIFVVLGAVAAAHGFSILRFLRYIGGELLIVLGASSSEAALPRMMAKMELLGAHKSVVGLVIPAGYSFNLDGTSIYLTMATLFIAQATNVHLSLSQQLGILAVLLLTSKGAAGVTGSGFIVLAATLSTVGTIPVAGVALILGIDRFMSEARALTNVIGNGVATLVVARWCHALDMETLDRQLRAGPPADLAVAGAPGAAH